MLSLSAAVAAIVCSSAGQVVLLDFYSDHCAPCRSMMPSVAALESKGYPIRRVNIQQEPAMAAQFGVNAVPCFILLADGQPVDRVEGSTTMFRLESMFRKAKGEPPAGLPGAPLARGPGAAASPMPMAAPPMTTGDITSSGAPSSGNAMSGALGAMPGMSAGPMPGMLPNGMPSAVAGAMSGGGSPAGLAAPPAAIPASFAAPASPLTSADSPAPLAANDPLLSVSVRLKITDPNGRSCGSGTIIDARAGEALVLTCGHIFRDSKGQGRVEVDLFNPSGVETVEGALIDYDLQSDVGLVSFAASHPVAAARVAPAGYRAAEGDPVITVGCNNGGAPTVLRTRITAVDRVVGPPNYKVAGQPVEGRSGGGLFTEDGMVIGVCNAAYREDHDGLYAAVGSIQAMLDRKGLAFVYQGTTPNVAAAAGGRSTLAGLSGAPNNVIPASFATASQSSAAQPPADLAALAAASMAAQGGAQGMPAALQALAAAQGGPQMMSRGASAASSLSPQEQAAADEICKRIKDGAEVICIVRSTKDPNAKSEVFTLERVSPQFVRNVVAATSAPATPVLTSLDIRNVPPGGVRSSASAQQQPTAANSAASASSAGGAPLRLEWSASEPWQASR